MTNAVCMVCDKLFYTALGKKLCIDCCNSDKTYFSGDEPWYESVGPTVQYVRNSLLQKCMYKIQNEDQRKRIKEIIDKNISDDISLGSWRCYYVFNQKLKYFNKIKKNIDLELEKQ